MLLTVVADWFYACRLEGSIQTVARNLVDQIFHQASVEVNLSPSLLNIASLAAPKMVSLPPQWRHKSQRETPWPLIRRVWWCSCDSQIESRILIVIVVVQDDARGHAF
jgi:hypothetical protein